MTEPNTTIQVSAKPRVSSQQLVFEAWAAVQDPPYNCERYATGKYRMMDTRSAWAAWQASRSAELARVSSILDQIPRAPGTAASTLDQVRAALVSSSDTDD